MEKQIFSSDFERRSYIERIFFNNFNNIYKFIDDDKYKLTETHYTSDCRYDYLIQNRTNYKTIILEIKIRKKTHETYFYELKKHKSLTKIKNINPDYNTIWYMNSTPEGTFIWNIDKILHKYKLVEREMNIATSKSNDKEDKMVYELKKEDAFCVKEFHWDDSQFIEHFEKKKIEKDRSNRRLEEDKLFLDEILFGKREPKEIIKKESIKVEENVIYTSSGLKKYEDPL